MAGTPQRGHSVMKAHGRHPRVQWAWCRDRRGARHTHHGRAIVALTRVQRLHCECVSASAAITAVACRKGGGRKQGRRGCERVGCSGTMRTMQASRSTGNRARGPSAWPHAHRLRRWGPAPRPRRSGSKCPAGAWRARRGGSRLNAMHSACMPHVHALQDGRGRAPTAVAGFEETGW